MTISDTIINRKGARSPKEVPEEVLNLLNSGRIPSVNLSEWLAINQKTLLKAVFSEAGYSGLITEFTETLNGLKKQTTIQLIRAIGELMNDSETLDDKVGLIQYLSEHKSDSVRCWAAYALGLDRNLALSEKFEAIRPYAADHHFGVREIAWFAVRDTIIEYLEDSLNILEPWSLEEDENLRRFASEATRPRGVWCPHIEVLKEAPEKALPLLAPLKSDSSKYVRDSVGNWLNDASKTQPIWVIDVCDQWKRESSTKETAYIVKKARRTIDKK